VAGKWVVASLRGRAISEIGLRRIVARDRRSDDVLASDGRGERKALRAAWAARRRHTRSRRRVGVGVGAGIPATVRGNATTGVAERGSTSGFLNTYRARCVRVDRCSALDWRCGSYPGRGDLADALAPHAAIAPYASAPRLLLARRARASGAWSSHPASEAGNVLSTIADVSEDTEQHHVSSGSLRRSRGQSRTSGST